MSLFFKRRSVAVSGGGVGVVPSAAALAAACPPLECALSTLDTKKLHPFHIAIIEADFTAVREFLAGKKAKQELMHFDEQLEQYPLFSAIQMKNVQLVSELLNGYKQHKIDINLQDKLGNSALHLACQYCDEQIICLILHFDGINVNLKNQDDNTPLHYFCEKFSSPQCQDPFQLFIAHHVDVNAVNKNGETPLHKSCFNKTVRMMLITHLLNNGAHVNQLNSHGEGPLHFAVRLNRDDLVTLLLKSGADHTIKGKSGKAPLDLAEESKNKQIAGRLQRVDDLCQWLRKINPEIYDLYRTKFISEALYLDVLPDVGDDLLQSIGIIEAAHRMVILKNAKLISKEPIRKDPRQIENQKSVVSHDVKTSPSFISSGTSMDKWTISPGEIEFTGNAGNKIGSGTSGKVYKALYRNMEVAVKVLRPFSDASESQEFEKEFEVMCVLRDPNIVKFFGICVESKLQIVMEYCNRDTLYDVMNNPHYEIGWVKTMQFAMQMTKGMICLHSFSPQILHRDFKSLNVLVTESWECKICDFGLSRFNTKENQMRTLKEVRGTFPYCAPEVVPNAEHPEVIPQAYTDKSDVYSMGIVIWELLKRCIDGKYSKPWYSEMNFQMDFMIVLYAQKGNRPTLLSAPLSEAKHGFCPVEMVELYREMVHPEPPKRPSTKEILQKLQAFEPMISEWGKYSVQSDMNYAASSFVPIAISESISRDSLTGTPSAPSGTMGKESPMPSLSSAGAPSLSSLTSVSSRSEASLRTGKTESVLSKSSEIEAPRKYSRKHKSSAWEESSSQKDIIIQVDKKQTSEEGERDIGTPTSVGTLSEEFL
eukprot:TRINITY_DN422_c0_g1_i2.p1 TRINITY_DN422_c0_g1~~TRINITY_DN422_c0_g1_i2.p1  ORF type:complete len:821 (-),score=198.20 TRINITY_DN422_c0_g1_i2:30-2492(-)